MKKRKILYLFPLAALVLSGCTFQEGWETFTSWMNDNIISPISSLFGGKKNSDSKKKDSSGGSVTPSTDGDEDPIEAEEIGSVDNPITMTEFKTLCDTNIDFNSIAASSSTTDFTHIAYLKAKVTGNTWNDEGTKILYLNLCDPNNSSSQATARYAIVDQAITGDYSEKDSMKGLEVVVRGYPALYNHPKNGKTYQLGSKGQNDNDNPRVLKVEANDPIPGVDYGSLESPLTISAAKSVIDLHKPKPTAKKLFVTGKVLSNDAYDQGYGNVMRITISEGQSSLVVFKCATFPEGFDGTAITENSLKNKTIVVSGLGELFNGSTYELTSPVIHSIEGEDVPPVVIDDYGSLESPLTVAQARAVVDAQSPTSQTMYVTGVIKSNQAYNTEYKNTNIWITDPDNTDVEFELYGCSLPQGFTPAQPVKNDPALVGKVVVAHGTGKIYGSTYEFDKGCAIDTIEDVAPIEVTGVQLSTDHVELQKGQSVKITASVLPAEASQEVEWSLTGESSRSLLSEGPATYDTETNILTAVDTGSATLTATSVADGTVSASCSIEITEATRVLSGIEIIESEPKLAYNAGEQYGHEGLTVQASYDNGDEVDVTDLVDWSYSKATAEVGDDELVVTATYAENEVEKSDSVTLQVTVTDPKGSLTNPYTGAEAAAVAAGLADKTPTEASYYIQGVVTAFNEAFNPTYGNYSFTIEGGFVGWRLLNGSAKAKFNEGDLEIGDTVTMYVQIQNYGGTPESSGGYVHEVQKCNITSVTVSGTLTQTEYSVDMPYNHSGLVATAETDTGISKDVSLEATWTPSKSTAELGDEEITFTAEYKNVSSEPYAVSVTVTSGTVLVETSIYKLDGSITGGTNGYATVSDITQGGLDWGVTANTTQNPWRFGGKGAVVRPAESKTALASDDVTKVVVTTGTANCKVNKVIVKVGTSQGASDISSLEITSGLTNATLTFTRPSGVSWAGRYFTIAFDVTCSDSSNQYIQLVSAEFFAMK